MRSRLRRGFLLKESIMAIAIAMVLVAGIGRLLATVAQQRRIAAEEALAAREAGNLMEDLAAAPWENTSAKELAALTLPPRVTRCLPDAAVSVEVTDEEDDLRRLRLRIEWTSSMGEQGREVSLVGWKYRVAGGGS